MAIPLLIAAGIAGLGSAIGGAVGSANAAAAQEKSAKDALALQQQMYAQQRADQLPWLVSGQNSLSDLVRRMGAGEFERGFDPRQLGMDPGYQFRMAEGQRALERSAAARGGLNSGAFMKGLSRYSQGVASDEFNNAWNRHRMTNTDNYNRLASMAGVGQMAAQNLGSAGAGYANSASNLHGAIGNAQAAGAMGTANAFGQGFQTLGNLAMLGYGGGFGGGGGGAQIPQQAPPQIPYYLQRPY